MEAWREQYLAEAIAPIILPKARELIASHEARGHLTVIVTAANSFITAPIARMYRRRASARERSRDRRRRIHRQDRRHSVLPRGQDPSGSKRGSPSRGQALPDFAESYFYGDSQSDVPLMEKVTHPVVVGPDEALAQLAQERNWPVISLR